MQFCSKAPLRISFAGGGSDVEPYLSEFGGLVLSATIDRYTWASMRPNGQQWISVRSAPNPVAVRVAVGAPPTHGGEVSLVEAALARTCGVAKRQGMEIDMRSDVAPGTGLGGSSALVVALVGLLREWSDLPLVPEEIAEAAYQAERLDLRSAGGKQDHYAAAFGGFNLIEFSRATTRVFPLPIGPAILHDLQARLLLCNTGVTRHSAQIIAQQVSLVTARQHEALDALHELKQLALVLKDALLEGRLDDFGALLHEAWICKKRLAAQVSNAHIEELYAAARAKGALGGKLCGAGAGGYMVFYCPLGQRPAVVRMLERMGTVVENFTFSGHGVQVWREM